MGLFDALNNFFQGEDAAARDARLSEREQRLVDRGLMAPDVRAANDALAARLNSEVEEDFYIGIGEGAENLRRGGDSLIGGTLKTILRAVPVWLWIGLIVAAVVYFWPILGPRVKRMLA